VDQYEIVEGARRYELWEGNIAAQIGLGKAADYALTQSVELVWDRIVRLSTTLRELISALPGFSVHDRGSLKSGIVTFSCRHKDASEVTAWLRREHAINTSVSAVQLTRTDLLRRGVTHLVRASVHDFNTEDEVDRLASALETLTRGQCDDRSARFRPHEEINIK